MKKETLLFLTILIEGYVVLAVELLAMRQILPYVGSGIEIIAIIISSVLLPLAIGYHAGSRRFEREFHRPASRFQARQPVTIRRILLRNLTTALIILSFGLSSLILWIFFDLLRALGISHHIVTAFLYGLIFLVVPVYLLAQTIPLVSHYFSHHRLSEMTGRMLFFSTLGSFLGSVVSTIVLMTTIGVNHTVIATLSVLGLLALLLTRRWYEFENILVFFFLGLVVMLNRDASLREANNIIADTPYNQVAIRQDTTGVEMGLNNSYSSRFAKNPADRFPYIRYIEEQFLNEAAAAPRNVLVIGAGGFTLGYDDRRDHFTFVDIDPALKPLAERYLLPEPLPPTKRFVAKSARDFLNHDSALYDLIVVDVFNSRLSIPMEVVTREFLLNVKARMKPGGALVVNIISSPTFSDKFSVRYHNTFASVFPVFSRQSMEAFRGFKPNNPPMNNLYIYYNSALTDDRGIYTDDRNTYTLDRKY